MMSKIKVVLVEYLNTIPLRSGLEELGNTIDLELKNPRACGEAFFRGDADIALIPVGSWIAEGRPYEIITDYCIGAVGEVATVELYAHEPVNELNRIYLDNHSRTSNLLIKILCRDHFRINVEFVEGDVSDINLSSQEGKLMIGDKVFRSSENFKYRYDLAQEWHNFQQAPFVFAIWVAKPHVEQSIIDSMNTCFQQAFLRLDTIISDIDPQYPTIDLDKYYSKHISYTLDAAKRRALDTFISLAESTIAVS